jgi:hypothetical protein
MNPMALRPSTSAKAMAVNHRAGIIHCEFARKNQLVTIAAWKINAFVPGAAPWSKGRKDKVQKNTGQGRTAASDDRSEPA